MLLKMKSLWVQWILFELSLHCLPKMRNIHYLIKIKMRNIHDQIKMRKIDLSDKESLANSMEIGILFKML